MSTDVFNDEQLVVILRRAAELHETAKVRTYSGRGMNGRECVGVVLADMSSLLEFGLRVAQVVAVSEPGTDEINDTIEDLSNALCNPQVESLGKGIIVYWPSINVGEQ